MTLYSLTMLSAQEKQLNEHLIRDDGCERAAYLLCSTAKADIDPWEQQAHEKFLVRKVIPIPDNDLLESEPTHVTWPTRSFVQILKEAKKNQQVVAVVHNHPSGPLGFSAQDDANEQDLLQGAINRNGMGTRLISLVMIQNGQLVGRIWRNPSKTGYDLLTIIRSIGPRFSLHCPDDKKATNLEAFHRQALAFGHAFNQDLRKLRVGIIGCGGTGSAVAMLLARLGVAQIALIDNDIVDRTNLNRLHGSRQSDADAMTSKVATVARSISEMALGVRVVAEKAWVGDEVCRDILKCCDILFGCTDDHEGRAFINRFAYYYLTPVIDIGLAIGVDPECRVEGRVTVLAPESTCLLCRETINSKTIAEQALKRQNPAEHERQKAEAYVLGSGDPSPAVVTFTTELACMGVNEMIHRLQGFRGNEGNADNRVRKFHQDQDRRLGKAPRSGCQICETNRIWGAGDVEPFMDRVP